jgi:hypothetical protein
MSDRSGFHVQPLTLDDAGTMMRSIVLGIQLATKDLEEGLARTTGGTDPFSRDDVGRKAAEIYAREMDRMYKLVQARLIEMADIGVALRDGATSYLDLDHDATAGLRAVGGLVDGTTVRLDGR